MRDRFGFSSRALANPSVYIISFSSVRKPGSSHPDSKIIKKLDLLASDLRTLEKPRAKVDETNAKLKDKRILDAKASSESFSRDFFERPEKGGLDPDARFEARSLSPVLSRALHDQLTFDYEIKYIAWIQYDFPQVVGDLDLLRILQLRS